MTFPCDLREACPRAGGERGSQGTVPRLFRHARVRGCQEILWTNKFVVLAQAGTQGQEAEIPTFPRFAGTTDKERGGAYLGNWITPSKAGIQSDKRRRWDNLHHLDLTQTAEI